MPGWLISLAWLSVGLGLASALIIALDIARGRRQHMWIMNVVWPLTALYSGPLGLWAYAFQYFTIKPMKGLSPAQGLKAAVKADTASLTAWQVGMYGWMAIAIFIIFGHEIPKTSPVFWFMMQVAMLAGLLTAYPVNRWLITARIKERM